MRLRSCGRRNSKFYINWLSSSNRSKIISAIPAIKLLPVNYQLSVTCNLHAVSLLHWCDRRKLASLTELSIVARLTSIDYGIFSKAKVWTDYRRGCVQFYEVVSKCSRSTTEGNTAGMQAEPLQVRVSLPNNLRVILAHLIKTLLITIACDHVPVTR